MNPYPMLPLMERIATLLVAGVEGNPPLPTFVQKGGTTWIQQKYKMSRQTKWPACHLEAGMQLHSRNSNRTHIAQVQVIISMYDRWNAKQETIDDIRAGLDSDVELLMATLQSNENLTLGNNAMATSIPRYSISPYKGEIDEQFAGMNLVFRTLTPTINVLPYD